MNRAIWHVQHKNYTAWVNIEELGLLPKASFRKLLKLALTGEEPESVDLLIEELPAAMLRAKTFMDKALTDPESLFPKPFGCTARERTAYYKHKQTEAKKRFEGLKWVASELQTLKK